MELNLKNGNYATPIEEFLHLHMIFKNLSAKVYLLNSYAICNISSLWYHFQRLMQF